MATYLTTVERETLVNGNDVTRVHEVAVEYSYYGATRGARDSLGGIRGAGPALEPDEPAHVEIESVTDEDGLEITLTPSEEERITTAIENSENNL
jgi:hypothetical protein